jgi:hypothetical protein
MAAAVAAAAAAVAAAVAAARPIAYDDMSSRGHGHMSHSYMSHTVISSYATQPCASLCVLPCAAAGRELLLLACHHCRAATGARSTAQAFSTMTMHSEQMQRPRLLKWMLSWQRYVMPSMPVTCHKMCHVTVIRWCLTSQPPAQCQCMHSSAPQQHRTPSDLPDSP